MKEQEAKLPQAEDQIEDLDEYLKNLYEIDTSDYEDDLRTPPKRTNVPDLDKAED